MKKLWKKLSGLARETEAGPEYKEDEDNITTDEADYAEEETENDEEETEDEAAEETAAERSEDEWLAQTGAEEGQLSIDVYQTPETIVVKSTIAGVKPEDIDISINNDMLTIRGRREMQEKIATDHYLFRECYWGSFSRSIILPVEVEADQIEAFLENGVLTVVLPKAKNAKQISIKVREK